MRAYSYCRSGTILTVCTPNLISQSHIVHSRYKILRKYFHPDCGIPEKTGYVFGNPVPDSLFGGEVSVSCASCYQGPPDKTELKCQANGLWEDVTGCTQIGMITTDNHVVLFTYKPINDR